MFDTVIFDWDGTLADTLQVIIHSFQEVLKSIGCEVSDEFLEKQIGIGARNMFKNALNSSNILFNDQLMDKLVEKKNKIHSESITKIKLFDGVLDLLQSLNPKVKIALATMSSRKVINKLLRDLKVIDYFDLIITADEVKQAKPNPEIFIKCALKLKSLPEECVVVEDSIFGVIAAKKAKMKCIAISSGAYSIQELTEENPDLIVSSISEKDKILSYIIQN